MLQGPFGVIGLGLIGGSIARALKKLNPTATLLAFETDPQRRALAQGIGIQAHEAIGLEVSQCQTIFLCLPVGVLESGLEALKAHIFRGALLIDVCGVKVYAAELIGKILPGIAYVGTHPMAGGKEQGFEHSRADLFKGFPVAVCPSNTARQVLTESVIEFWKSLEAKPLLLEATEHDQQVAFTSHLPYISALALVGLLEPETTSLAGRGLLAAARQASFAPGIMADTVCRNPYLADAVKKLMDELQRLYDILRAEPGALKQMAFARQRHMEAVTKNLQ